MSKLQRIIKSLFLTGVLSANIATAANAEVIGLSIPLSGDAAELGREFRAGAKLAMEKYGQAHQLFIADDGCDPDLAKLAMDDLASQSPAIITGFLCNEVAIIGANQLRESGIPLLINGARSVRLIKDRDREEWNLWRMSPGDDYAYKASAKEIINRWKARPYAIIDDGTIFGRAYTDGMRLPLNEAGLPPQISDNFRAAQSTQAGLLRRLQRSGATAAFVAAATSEDLFLIAKNRKELGVEVDFIMSEQLAILPYLVEAKQIPEGLMVIKEILPKNTERDALDKQLAEREMLATEQVYAGYAAMQVAINALGNTSLETVRKLQSKQFETIVGPVKFDAKGANITNPYKLHVWDGRNLVLPDNTNTPTQ